jgi:dihydrodipicolinate synthase/N-acetylneuraminate lyase
MWQPSILVALLTPLTNDGDIHQEALACHVTQLRSAGVDGFFVCGTTGEGPLLDHDEVITATRVVLDACDHANRVIVQVGRPSTKASLKLLNEVLDLGANGVTAVTPYYYEIGEARMETHYRDLIRAASGHPVYAYIIPRRTGTDISASLARTLAVAGMAGIKDSTRSLERHLEYLKIAQDPNLKNFQVYMGTDSLALSAFEKGSSGIVSALANIRPDLFVSLQSAMAKGQTDLARAKQNEIDALRQTMSLGNTIANLKCSLSQRLSDSGFEYPTSVRRPLG